MTKEKTGRPVGRPSEYDPVVVDEICGRIATGESLRAICLADDMPNESTFRKWVQSIDDANKLYLSSNFIRINSQTDAIMEISEIRE